ncbi:large-conductance mechanosensitive channel protein MscL [Corynebacterium sp. 32222D000AT]
MLKGFKDFILRGNVIELAIAVIIGSAFTAIVTAVTDSLIQPLINSFGSAEVGGLAFQIKADDPTTRIDLGAVITAAINFLIIAAVVYFLIVMPMNKLAEAAKRRQGIAPEEATPTTDDLLIEIRDLLAAQNNVSDKVTGQTSELAEDSVADTPGTPGTTGASGASGAAGDNASGKHRA